nr:ribosomal protein L16 [Actinocyclus sp. mgcode 4]
MLLQPKKLKFKKLHKKKFRQFKYKTLFLKFGTIGLKALECSYISSFQLKSITFALSKKLKKKGKIWYNVFPNSPITAKPIEVRMGKGKGSLKHWSGFVNSGFIILEVMSNINKLSVVSILKSVSIKLPLKTKVIF